MPVNPLNGPIVHEKYRVDLFFPAARCFRCRKKCLNGVGAAPEVPACDGHPRHRTFLVGPRWCGAAVRHPRMREEERRNLRHKPRWQQARIQEQIEHCATFHLVQWCVLCWPKLVQGDAMPAAVFAWQRHDDDRPEGGEHERCDIQLIDIMPEVGGLGFHVDAEVHLRAPSEILALARLIHPPLRHARSTPEFGLCNIPPAREPCER